MRKRLLDIVLVLAFVSSPFSAFPVWATDPVQIAHCPNDPTVLMGGDVNRVKMAKDSSGNLYLIYSESATPCIRPWNALLAFTRSLDGGSTWSTPVLLSDHVNNCHGEMPTRGVIRIDSNDTIHVLYEYIISGTHFRITHLSSNDLGTTWSPPHVICDGYCLAGMLALDSQDTLYVTYGRGYQGNIYLKKSTDSGVTWSPETVAVPPYSSSYPYAGLHWLDIDDNDNIHIAVRQDNHSSLFGLFYSRSTDLGHSFSPPLLIADEWSVNPILVHDNNNDLFVIYTGVSDLKSYLLKSDDDGNTFLTMFVFDNAPFVGLGKSNISIDSENNLYFYYVAEHPTKDLYARVSRDGGSTFGSPVNVSLTGTAEATGQLLPNNDETGFLPVWVDSLPDQYSIVTTGDYYVVDSDGDGIPDNEDNCPLEDSTGLDADEDGCIDTFGGLTDVLGTLVENDVIDEELENSLVSKIGNAEKSATKENICAAVNQLGAFKNQIDAQRGSKISDDAADLLVSYANNLINQLLSDLPEGETC